MARVKSNVHVVHPKKGGVWLREGDEVPGWASSQIRRSELLDHREPEPEPDTGDDEDEVDDSTVPPEPPRAGPGASAAAWLAFARHPAVDLDVDDDATRHQIMEAWDAVNADEDPDNEPHEGAQEPHTDSGADEGDTSGDDADGQQEPDTGDDEAGSEFPPEPPRSGAGSGVDAWREFAAHPAVDLDVDDDATRHQIMEAWDAVNADEDPDNEPHEGAQEPHTDSGADEGDTSGDDADGQQEPDTGDDEAGSEFPPEPPRSGAGSGVDAWREFAAHPAVDLGVDEDASRDDIIAAWDAANAGE